MLGSTLTSFAFLTDTHVLIADLDLTEEGSGPSLVALNFSKPKSGAVHLESTEDASFFQFPPVSCPDITDMHIRSDPAPGWRPSSDLQVPFYASRDRLFVVTLRVRHPIRDHVFFVPTSTFLPHLTEGSCRHVPWDTWVPHGSRLLRHLSLSSTWVCYVYGQRVIARSDAGPIRDSLLLLDFDQKRCRHARFRGEFLGINTKATTITPAQNTIFNATIKTDLPFRCAVIKLPHPSSLDAAEVAMCSEDGIVIVNVGLCDESRDRKFDLIAVASSQVSYIVALNIRS